MNKLREKYGAENVVSQMIQGCYNTGFTVFDYDNILGIGDTWLPKELFLKILDHKKVEFSDEENKHVNDLLIRIKANIPALNLNVHKHRIIAATNIIAKLPKGARDWSHALVVGFTGIGKTTMVSQECGYIYRSLKHNRLKDGTPKTKIYYYMTEPGAIEINGFKKLTGMDNNDIKEGLVMCGGATQSTADFMKMIVDINTEKLKNQLDYAIDVMSADGTYKKTISPTLIILDSFSSLEVEKYVDKQATDYAKGKDGSKESDMMRSLQVKATMLQTSGLFSYCESANIMIYFIGHVGNDMGDMMGHQQMQMNKGHNSKLGFKMKGIPQGLGYLMARNYSIYQSIKKDIINDMYKREDLIFGININIEKQRGGEVYKNKTLPLIFKQPGYFDNGIGTFHYYQNDRSQFDFVKGVVDGIYKVGSDEELQKIAKGEDIDEKIFNNPLNSMIVANNLFRDFYIDKVYSDNSVLSSQNINDIMSSAFDFSGLLADDSSELELEIDVIIE